MLTDWLVKKEKKEPAPSEAKQKDHVVLRFPNGEPAMLKYDLEEWTTPEEADELFRFLLYKSEWVQVESEMGLEKRLKSSFSASGEYEYNGVTNKSQRAQDFPIIAKTNDKFRKLGIVKPDDPDPSYWFNGCYRDGSDIIGPHFDKEYTLDVTKPIISMSFGESRIFRITKNHTPVDFTLPKHVKQERKSLWPGYEERKKSGKRKRGEDFVMDLPLHHGTLIVMCAGMGQYFKHAIPKATQMEIAASVQLEGSGKRQRKQKWSEVAPKLSSVSQIEWSGDCRMGLRINTTCRWLRT